MATNFRRKFGRFGGLAALGLALAATLGAPAATMDAEKLAGKIGPVPEISGVAETFLRTNPVG